MMGGVVDVFFLDGPTLEEVVRQYQQLVGRPAMPPAWSLGFHQCRWGYRTVEDVAAVVKVSTLHFTLFASVFRTCANPLNPTNHIRFELLRARILCTLPL